MTTKEASGETEIVLVSSLDIAQGSELRSQFSNAIAAGLPIVLDGGGVDRVDTAALQVLMAVVHDAEAQELDLQWSGISDTLVNAAGALGVSRFLSLPDSSTLDQD